MKNTSLLAVVAWLLVGGAACNRRPQSGPEAALERAYKSGILSKDEYEAKRAALREPPAPAPAPVAPVAAPPATPAAPAPLAPAPTPAPAAVAAVRVNRPKPAAPPVVAPEPPAREPAPAPQPVARRVNPPAPVPPPASVARDEEPPAPSACADTEARPGKEKGQQERFYPVPVARVRAAAVKALKDLEFNIHRATDTEIEASKKRHIGLVIGSGGERMTLHLEEAVQGNQKGTRVTGETKKGFVMRAGQKSWTKAVLDQTACMLHASARETGLTQGTGHSQSEY
jgi:hypothetical protein